VTLLLVIVGALLVYKGTAALAVIEQVRNTGAGFQPRVNVVPVPGNSVQVNVIARSMNYFLVIWPALLFGILISGAVRVLVQPRWLAQALGAGQAITFGCRNCRGATYALLMLRGPRLLQRVRTIIAPRTVAGIHACGAVAESRGAHTYVHAV